MKARYLLGVAILLAGVSIWGLRTNAQTSLDLKNRIVQQDLAGSDVKADINELREFVFSHMNSSVKFELSGSYERAAVQAQTAQVSDTLYRQAQAACDRQGVSSVDQAACVQEYLARRLSADTDGPIPPKSQYSYAFAAPGWSADLAGLSMVGAGVLAIAAAIVYIRNQFIFRLGSN